MLKYKKTFFTKNKLFQAIMMKKTIILTLCAVWSMTALAQKETPKSVEKKEETANFSATRSPFGIRLEKSADLDLYLKVVEGVGISAKDALNEQSLKSFMMPPRKANSGCSACYALSSALEFYINLNENYKDNLSPDYIRLSLPRGTIEDDLAFLANNGTVSAAILPFGSPNLTPSVQAAVRFKIKNYLKLFQATTRPPQKLYDLKKAVTRGNPVVVEMQVTNEFKTLKQARWWKADEGDKTPAGAHYLVVVGFDEEKKGVELLNSMGREWGLGGYIWVSYEDFGALATNAYVLMP